MIHVPNLVVLPDGVAIALGMAEGATISPAPQGMTSEVTFVRDHNQELVLKRCRNPIYIEWLRREHRVLDALSDSSLPIPRMIGYHEVSEAGEVIDAWLLMTRVPGQSLWDVLLGATPVERPGYLRALGHLLRTLHSTPPPEAFRNQPPWLERKLAQARNHLEWCDGTAELLMQLEATRPATEFEVLVHGDFALDNVLIDRGATMSLIDWSDGDVGDPRYDVALALATEPEIQLRDIDVAAFFDGYGGTAMDAATIRWFTNLYEFF